jgi:hypothetical protein
MTLLLFINLLKVIILKLKRKEKVSEVMRRLIEEAILRVLPLIPILRLILILLILGII